MVRAIVVGCISVWLLAGCGSSEKIPPPPKINCCIMNFESRTGMKAGEAESVMDMFAASLQQSNRFVVIERSRLNAILQEQGFQAAQNSGDELKAAKLLAVRKMFIGSIGMLGENYVLNLKMVDVETSAVDLSLSRTYDDDLEDIGKKFLPSVVQDILQSIDGTHKK